MGYLFLSIAIAAEVVATTALKWTSIRSGALPWIIVAFGYGFAFYFLSLVLKTIPIGIAYAIWSGVGIAAISIIGFFLFKQKLDLAALLGLVLIGLGVLVIQLFSETKSLHS